MPGRASGVHISYDGGASGLYPLGVPLVAGQSAVAVTAPVISASPPQKSAVVWASKSGHSWNMVRPVAGARQSGASVCALPFDKTCRCVVCGERGAHQRRRSAHRSVG